MTFVSLYQNFKNNSYLLAELKEIALSYSRSKSSFSLLCGFYSMDY